MQYLLGPELWTSITHWWHEFLGIPPGVLELMLQTTILLVIYLIIRFALQKVIARSIEEVTRRYTIRKTASYILNFLFLIFLARIWLDATGDLFTFLGLVSAGMAVALQDPITNLAGWIFIMVRQPFKVGDRVQVGTGHAGDVIDLRLFSFSLIEIGNWVDADQSTGRIIHIPNNVVFKQSLGNFTQGFEYIWNEIPVTVTFESDWKKAKVILEGIVQDHAEKFSADATRQIKAAAEKYMIFFKYLTPIVWVSVVDIGVTLTLRYVCKVRGRRSSDHEIWCEVLDAFSKEPGIDFAYPTQRVYYNVAEGKPGAGGPPAPRAVPKGPPLPIA